MKIRVIKMAMFISLLVIAGMVICEGVEAGVKAPLLTMLGGFTILAVLFPERKPTFSDIGIIVGTGIALVGSYYWYKDEIPGEEGLNFLFVLIYLAVGFVLIVWLLLWAAWFSLRASVTGFRNLRPVLSRIQSNNKDE